LFIFIPRTDGHESILWSAAPWLLRLLRSLVLCPIPTDQEDPVDLDLGPGIEPDLILCLGLRHDRGVASSRERPHGAGSSAQISFIACMGAIDLDPCSNSAEIPNVPTSAIGFANLRVVTLFWEFCPGPVFGSTGYCCASRHPEKERQIMRRMTKVDWIRMLCE
jgi:hypothetical protein